jgi:hypothetical protein
VLTKGIAHAKAAKDAKGDWGSSKA